VLQSQSDTPVFCTWTLAVQSWSWRISEGQTRSYSLCLDRATWFEFLAAKLYRNPQRYNVSQILVVYRSGRTSAAIDRKRFRFGRHWIWQLLACIAVE
jgi:hypothetical protein